MTPPPLRPQNSQRRHHLVVAIAVATVPALLLLGIVVIGQFRGEPTPAKSVEEEKRETLESMPARPPKPEVAAEEKESEKKSATDSQRELLENISSEEERMAARVKRVMDEPKLSTRQRRHILSEMAHRAGQAGTDESSEMLAAVDTVPAGELRIALYSGVLQARCDKSPPDALKLCGVLEDPMDQAAARAFVARHWGYTDLPAAVRAVEAMDFPEQRTAAAAGLLQVVSQRSEQAKAELRRKDLNPDVARVLAMGVAEIWQGGLDDLKKTIATSGNPEVLTGIMAGYSVKHPQDGLAYLTANPQAEFHEPVIQHMGMLLARGGAQAALETRLSGANFAQRKLLVDAIFLTWLRMDFKAAGNWLKEKEELLGDPVQADEIKGVIVTEMLHRSADESAEAWAQRIKDPEKRAQALESIRAGVPK